MRTQNIKIIIPLVPRTKKNSQQIIMNSKTNKPIIIPSAIYKQYEKNCGWFIKKGLKIDKPCNIKCLYYMPTKRRVDLVNLLEATMDMLVTYEVLVDDNCEIVVSHDGSRVLYDKNNSRTEIYIEFY